MKIGGIGQAPMEYNRNKLMAVDTCNKRIRVYSIPEKVMINYLMMGCFRIVFIMIYQMILMAIQ